MDLARNQGPPKVAIRSLVGADTSAVLGAILSATDYGVLYTDLNHVALACNSRFSELWGVEPDQVVQANVEELRERVRALIPDVKRWETLLEEIYSDPFGTYEDEQPLNSEPRKVLKRFSGPVLEETGRPIGRLWTFRDITKEVRARELSSALNQVNLFFAADPNEVYQHVVDTMARQFPGAVALLSIQVGEFLEFRAAAGVPADAPAIRGNDYDQSYCQYAIEARSLSKIIDATADAKYANLLPRRLGLTRYMGVPLYGEDGEVIGTLCVIDANSGVLFEPDEERFLSTLGVRVSSELARERHVTERIAQKQVEIAEREQSLAVTKEVLAVMNRSFGLMREELDVSLRYGEFVRSLAGISVFESVELAVNGPVQQSFHSERGGQVSVSSSRDVAYVGHVLERTLLAGGRTLGALRIGTTNEPTPLIEALFEALAEHASLVVFTATLQQDLNRADSELRRTQEKLLQSEKLSIVGTLAAETAHDIRNILFALSLELSMGASEPERALMSVRSHLDRFAVLAHRLLSYAKPRLVAKEPLSVNEVIERVLSLTASQLSVSNVQSSFSSRPGACLVMGDVHQLEHLFVNLVMNAVQAVEPSGGRIEFDLSQTSESVLVMVSDNGKGIDAEVLDRLFEPFSSTRENGFGLGLFSCKRIVEEHGGTIQVMSEKGKGSCFHVALPAYAGGPS